MTLRSWVLSLGLAFVLLGSASAQEGIQKVPEAKLREAAPLILELISRNLQGVGIKVDAVADNAIGYQSEGSALVLFPDRSFGAKSIESAGEKVAPAGIILLKKLAPVIQGQIPPLDRLALLGPEGDAREVTVLFLGVRKDASGAVLEVYSKDQKPLAQIPLMKKDAAAGAPLFDAKFANLDRTANQGDVVLTITGGHEATLRIGAVD